MQLGLFGLGRMGANMVRRAMRAGHECIVYNRSAEPRRELALEGAIATESLEDWVSKLAKPRVAWLMLPAAVVDSTLDALAPMLEPGDVVVDGGNSFYRDDIRRAKTLSQRKLHYVDVGVSGGVWGLERGYCLMIGGEPDVVRHLDPLFRALAPGDGGIVRTPGREGARVTAEQGYLHCGPNGAGHFVKMVHNGIEYGIMQAYAEGFNVLHGADAGLRQRQREADAETAPLRDPELYQYRFNLPDIAELWRRGSVIGSWLLDLTATSLIESPDLATFEGRVADSGEGRWTLEAAIDESVPVPVLSAALFERLGSRGKSEFADKLLSAMRFQFGGHKEQSKGA
jgi:6-phosphogluconate dehydrogenase